jgi:hypothetical protein
MNTTRIFRASLVALAFTAAIAANAQAIQIVSIGSAAPSGLTLLFNENVAYNSWGTGSLTSLSYGVTGLSGSGVYTNGVGNTLDFDLTYSALSFQKVGQSESFDGTWVYTGGTGAYAAKTGGGTLALNAFVTSPVTASTITSFSGTLAAVPEPASYAVLGIGALGLLVRRRKA